jgi:hypothetical protein
VIVVLDETRAHEDLAGGLLRCPGCGGRLQRWGSARGRSLRSSGGLTWLRPRRVHCAPCKVTHVVLPAGAPARHAYTMDVVGPALLASATGQGHRRGAAGLGLPAGTVRGWIRRASARAEWLRASATVQAHAFDPDASCHQSGGLPAG